MGRCSHYDKLNRIIKMSEAFKPWVNASSLTNVPAYKELLQRIERQGRKGGSSGKYERFVYTVEGDLRSVMGRYNTLFIRPNDATLERLFSTELMTKVFNHQNDAAAGDGTVTHFPWISTPQGELVLKIKYSDIQQVESLKDENAAYGFVSGEAGQTFPVRVSVITRSYADFPEMGHVGISIKAVSNVEVVHP